MSSQKARTLKRVIQYTATWLAGVLTVTTAATHYLKTTDVVSLRFNNSIQELNSVAVTQTGANTFTIPLLDPNQVQLNGLVEIGYYSAGMTGDQDVFSLPRATGAASIIQLTAHGAAGAVIVVSVSNDNAGWVVLGTVTLASTNLATDFISIAPAWTQAKLTITSIGAATTVVATTSA